MSKRFENKKIILGITGSIAAYKSALIARELIKEGADVRVIMTASACEFITPLTLSNLTQQPVIVDMFDRNIQEKGAWHIDLSHWCDAMLIAPCTATTISRIAYGLCDNALTTVAVALPTDKPMLIAPAMDSTMYLSKQVQSNLALLANYGYVIIPPAEGELSSGLIGPGRLPEINVILDYLENSLLNKSNNKFTVNEIKIENKTPRVEVQRVTKTDKETELKLNKVSEEDVDKAVETSVYTLHDALDKDKWTAELELDILKNKIYNLKSVSKLSGKKILITAGPTIEKIDDVRFISNFSSGKMGFALAKIAKAMNADVILVTGPVNLPTPYGVERFDVESAEEMFDVTIKEFEKCDIAILSAAVSDFTPTKKIMGKLKKSDVGFRLNIELQSTRDILAYLSANKRPNQLVVGFALESENEIENGWKKLKEKDCDMIIVNSATKSQSGFRGDYNTITILSRDGNQISFPPMTKEKCSIEILDAISKYINNLKK